MAKLIPKYSVIYRGKIYNAGQVIPLLSKDIAEMKKHGKIIEQQDEKDSADKNPDPKDDK